jgi:hypothetical protein
LPAIHAQHSAVVINYTQVWPAASSPNDSTVLLLLLLLL